MRQVVGHEPGPEVPLTNEVVDMDAPMALLRPMVWVVSDQTLVAESVQAGLASRGFPARVVTLDVSAAVLPPAPRSPEGASQAEAPVVLLLEDLATPVELGRAQTLIRGSPGRWIVLTSVPPGALWGALLASGADVVTSSGTSLDDLEQLLDDLARGGGGMDPRLRADVLDRWERVSEEQERLLVRMRSLTPRERTVLRLLYAGDTVRSIAVLLDVSEATVRSQVKAVLRKLDVNSQLAAIAAFRRLQEGAKSTST
ncbi:LuxR C-terminal-related transcriptional regulator [Nocardioides sp.]|uniref:helix-turn-helix transcriptional regulator n=1 Tax=Nocardioides sp. TaxID=35761 RepID=UPI0031FF14E5|nr:bvgA [Nocardioides sp.]